MSRSEPSSRRAPDSELLTTDSVLGGAVRFRQPASGYRVNIDSVLLAAFAAEGRPAQLALDLGAGVGVLALLLHHFAVARRFVLVERDPELAACAEQNLACAGADAEVLVRELGESELPEALLNAVDLVVTNPPFFTESEHRAPRDAGRRRARQGTLSPFLEAAATVLDGSRARAVVAYPARSLAELLEAARAARLVAKRLRLVHAFIERPARLALVELRRARPGGLVVEPPLVEWQALGVPGPELARLNGVRAGDRE